MCYFLELLHAQGELEWLLATLATLQEGRYLTVGKVEKQKGAQFLVDLAAAANSRCVTVNHYSRQSATVC
jgi:hypothetical protein